MNFILLFIYFEHSVLCSYCRLSSVYYLFCYCLAIKCAVITCHTVWSYCLLISLLGFHFEFCFHHL